MDLERLQRINATLDTVTAQGPVPAGVGLKRIETLVISPSQRFDPIAARHAASLPRTLHLFLRGIGATRHNGAALLSYLLFERGYTRALMQLGLRDAMARREEIARFLGGEPRALSPPGRPKGEHRSAQRGREQAAAGMLAAIGQKLSTGIATAASPPSTSVCRHACACGSRHSA